jgi:hypothetical protein
MKNGKYFIYENSLTGEKFIAKNYEMLRALLSNLNLNISEKCIRHHFNQIGVINIEDMSITYFIENTPIFKMLYNYIEKQK